MVRVHPGFFHGMWFLEQLLWGLTVSSDHLTSGLLLYGILDGVEIESVVGSRVEDIDCVH